MLKIAIRIVCAVLSMGLMAQPVFVNAAPHSTVTTPNTENFSNLLIRVGKTLQAEDYETAYPALQEVVAHPEFHTLPADLRYTIYYALALCDMEVNNGQMALSYLQQAHEIDPLIENKSFWFQYFWASLYVGNMSESVKALNRLDRIDPQFVLTLDQEFWLRYLADLRDEEALKYRVLEILWSRNYAYETAYMPEYIWWSFFNLDIKHNNAGRAAQLAPKFRDPGYVLKLLIDFRYSAFGTSLPDYERALRDHVDVLRSKAEKNTDMLGPKVQYGYMLLQTGRPDGLVAIFEPIIVAMEADPAQFSDYDDQSYWVYDTYARALDDMGRHDDALKALNKGYELSIKMGETVSLKINLAGYYNDLGRPKDALRILSDFDPEKASDYGLVSAYAVRACAYAQLGDSAGLEETMALVKPIAHKGILPFIFALACVGDEEVLVTYIVDRLNDPDTRTQMLEAIQSYRPEPFPLALEIKQQAALEAAIARAEVQSVVGQYGRIYELPTYRLAY